jgi:hypothetical protein
MKLPGQRSIIEAIQEFCTYDNGKYFLGHEKSQKNLKPIFIFRTLTALGSEH